MFVIIFGVEVEVYYSSIKQHKLKRRVELKERKILEILKNHLGQFYELNNDNSQLHTANYGLSNLWTIYHILEYYILVL